MNTTIAKLIGKDVTVTLLSTYLVKGILLQCDDTFLVVEEEKGEAVIPLTSVLKLVATPLRATK
jgi:small nuclear ribonucleoprotein (snRNP)-like protein